MAGQRRRGGFVYGAGEGDVLEIRQEPQADFDLTDDRNAGRACRFERRSRRRNSRARDDESTAGDAVEIMSAELDIDALRTKDLGRAGQLIRLSRVRRIDVRTGAGEKLRGGTAASRQSNDRDLSVCPRGLHRNGGRLGRKKKKKKTHRSLS